MARKAYNIQAIDPRPSLQKKKVSSGRGGVEEGGTEGDWTRAIDNPTLSAVSMATG